MDVFGIVILSVAAVVLSTPYQVMGEEEHTWTCPTGWLAYTHEATVRCLYISTEKAIGTMMVAHKKCMELDSNLVVMDSKHKWTFVTGLMLKKKGRFWLGLQKINGKTYWLTKTGPQLEELLPTTLYWWDDDYYNLNIGQVYFSSTARVRRRDKYDYDFAGDYICEKEPDCNTGWFGLNCDNECHCHGKACDPKDVNGTCLHGCQVGWMGNDCTQPKEDATLKYYCVNSPDLGQYLHVRVDTKGVRYDHIHAIDEDDMYTPWCNNTHITFNQESSVETIIIYMGGEADVDMTDGKCAGHKGEDGYEWKIKIQEKEGFVSLNDQKFRVTCNKSSIFDTMTASAGMTIDYGDKDFEHLKSQEELLDLQIVDAFTGLPVTKKPIGHSIALKLRYGLGPDNDATGVMPYNCEASSADGSHRSNILDAHGCPLPGSPITEFANNGSKSLVTQPFPLLSFPGSRSIAFNCAYKLCFDNEECDVGCRSTDPDHDNKSKRHKRSTARIVKPKMVSGSIEVEYPHHWRQRRYSS